MSSQDLFGDSPQEPSQEPLDGEGGPQASGRDVQEKGSKPDTKDADKRTPKKSKVTPRKGEPVSTG